MKNLITKTLGIAGITALSFLPMKAHAQMFKNSAGEIFNLTDTLEKYNNNKNYIVGKEGWKMGNANNPSGHQNTISISFKGSLEPEIILQFDDKRNNVGNFVVEPGYLSYKTHSFKKINEDSLLCTLTKKFYGNHPSSNPEAYPTETRFFTREIKTKEELVIKDGEGRNLHYLFMYNKQGTAYDKVIYSMIIDGGQIIIKDSLYDKELDYFSYEKEGYRGKGILLKNKTEIENATKEKDGATKKEIYDWRDNFEGQRFCSFKKDLMRGLDNINKEFEKEHGIKPEDAGIKIEVH